MRAGADWAWWADTNCEVLSVWPGDSQCSKQINYFVYTRHGGVMQSRDQEQWAGPKLSNGCQPFGPVSTNYSSISGERQSASGKATRGMSWIIISLHPDLANITLLSAQTAGSNTGDWNVGGDPRWCPPPLPPPVTLQTPQIPRHWHGLNGFIYPVRIIPALRPVSQHLTNIQFLSPWWTRDWSAQSPMIMC